MIIQGFCIVFVARTNIGLTGNRGSHDKYTYHFAALTHILDVITINSEVT
jgi:hypothetical protein